jgi:hypothetical protein
MVGTGLSQKGGFLPNEPNEKTCNYLARNRLATNVGWVRFEKSSFFGG